MHCPIADCGMKAAVLQTRSRDGYVYRRYACAAGHRFSTGEGVIDKGGAQRVRRADIARAVTQAENAA